MTLRHRFIIFVTIIVIAISIKIVIINNNIIMIIIMVSLQEVLNHLKARQINARREGLRSGSLAGSREHSHLRDSFPRKSLATPLVLKA